MTVASMHIGMEGWIRMVAHKVDADGNIISTREAAPWFHNLITDAGENMLAGISSWRSYCHVGSGNTPPTVSDASLITRIATVGDAGESFRSSYASGASPDRFIAHVTMYRFAVGVAAGNISEVGFGGTTAGTPLFSRALIQDLSGNPTSITVLSDEILDVYYEFRVYPPADTGHTGIVTISGVDYAYECRPAQVTSRNAYYSTAWGSPASSRFALQTGTGTYDNEKSRVYPGVIGPATSVPAGSYGRGFTSAVSGPYVPGTKELVCTGTIDLASGNLPAPGFRCLVLSSSIGLFQVQFTPAIPKTNANTFSLTLKFTWGRRSL